MTERSHVVSIQIKCCVEHSMIMNRDGILSFRCIYCGFELIAGKLELAAEKVLEPNTVWSP